MKEIETKILKALSSGTEENAREIAGRENLQYEGMMSALNFLETEELIAIRKEPKKFAELSKEGKNYFRMGFPERRFADALKEMEGSATLEEIAGKASLKENEKAIALAWAKRKGWISLEKKGNVTAGGNIKAGKNITVGGNVKAGGNVEAGKNIAAGRSVTEAKLIRDAERGSDERLIGKIADGKIALSNEGKENEEEIAKRMEQRNLVKVSEEKEIFAKITTKGMEELSHGEKNESEISQLTSKMLKTREWKEKKFREYDLNTVVAPVSHLLGKKHPYLQFIREIKEKLVSLGFQEKEGPFIDTEFWNMDTLFMAQDHPAREIHDVFQVELPEGKIEDAKLVERVKKAHEKGLAGSKGWGYKWSETIAKRMVMRSQTTSVSARVLSKGIVPPYRMFCIGRVFRPDEIDWKHFIEFNQCEGIVCDENMSFRELLGYLKTFAVEVFGAEGVKFVPSYFPFTEPSVEMYAKREGAGRKLGERECSGRRCLLRWSARFRFSPGAWDLTDWQ